MSERKSQVNKLKYDFNGMENDNDIKGDRTLQILGARKYDSRLGRQKSNKNLSTSSEMNFREENHQKKTGLKMTKDMSVNYKTHNYNGLEE